MLAFASQSEQSKFENEERLDFIKNMSIAAHFCATPLVLGFSIVDYICYPNQWLEFLMLRLLVIPVSLLCYLAYKSKYIFQNAHYLPCVILVSYLSSYVVYIISRTDGFNSHYYSGINLVTVGAFTLLPMAPRYIGIILAAIYLPLFAFYALQFHNIKAYVPQICFSLSTAFICSIVCLVMRKLRFNEFKSRMSLESEIGTKDKIIDQRTAERVYLEKLTSHFSPQVIEAIKGGIISVDKPIRSHVAVIFIDLKNSTDRSSKIDYSRYAEVIQDFFSECAKILLQHELTIGAFLGDGLLAFGNAPLKVENYTEKCILACKSILELVHRKNFYYKSLWRNNFQIRIGVNSGYAFAGFFPSKQTGNYTIVGECVNLASRLCSAADANSILTTKSFILESSHTLSDMQVKKVDQVKKLKGFETEEFELFSVQIANEKIDERQTNLCPLCSKTLSIIEEFDNCSMVKCMSCGYKDMLSPNDNHLTNMKGAA